MSQRSVLVAAVLVPLAVAACATQPAKTPSHETPPDRPLFRLRAARVLPPPAEADVPDAPPPGPRVEAWQTELRIVRSDGTTLAAPRVVTLPGLRASMEVVERFSYISDFDVSVEGGAWIADPVVAMLAPGIAIEVAVFDVEGGAVGGVPTRPAETALAWRIAAGDLRHPVASRSILSTAALGELRLQFPRLEGAEASGARRVTVGAETEIARLPDPTGGGELVVRVRIARVTVPAPAAHAEPPATEDARRLLALGRSAAAGDRTGVIRVTAVRIPLGVEDADARGVERLARLSVSSVLAPGVRAADLLREAYLSDWDSEVNGHPGAFDPVVATHESGLSAEVAEVEGAGRSLVLRWRTTPRFERRRFSPVGFISDLLLELPESLAVERNVALAPGRSVHRVFGLPDGGTAALVVEID